MEREGARATLEGRNGSRVLIGRSLSSPGSQVHAYIISSLKKEMPSVFGKDNKKKELVNNLAEIYGRIEREHQISPGDFPNLKRMQVTRGLGLQDKGQSDCPESEGKEMAPGLPSVLDHCWPSRCPTWVWGEHRAPMLPGRLGYHDAWDPIPPV